MKALVILGWLLLLTGGAVAVICAFLYRMKARREGLLWRLAIWVVPLMTVLFIVRFWDEVKSIFYTQAVAYGVMATGFGLLMLDSQVRKEFMDAITPITRMVYAKHHRGDENDDDDDSTGAPHGNPSGRSAHLHRKGSGNVELATEQMDLLQEKRQKVQELYILLNTWVKELDAKRAKLPVDEPEEVRKFQEEYEDYQGLLGEYKADVADLNKPQTRR